VSSDEGDGNNWPGVRERVLTSDTIFFASPTWLGKISSVAQRALERMDTVLSEQNEQGQMIAYNRVAGFVVTGNEDGAKNCISELASAAAELGFCVPLLAWTYWNMGPGSGPDFADTALPTPLSRTRLRWWGS